VAEAICQIIAKDPTARILACAPSNSAADTIARRLLTFMQPTELLRLNSCQRPFAEVPEPLLPFTYSVVDAKSGTPYFDIPPVATILKLRVLVTTCYDAGMLMTGGLSNDESCSRFESYHRNLHHAFPYFHRELPTFSHLWTVSEPRLCFLSRLSMRIN
jgi:hypothetical protein